MANPLYTIGHSNHSLDDFIALLARTGITCLADIRTVPRSRSNPQFNRDTLPEALAAHGIAYVHMADLGGLRGQSKTVPSAANGYWENDSFHHYADYALGETFRQALEALIERGQAQPTAMMCAEAVWWRCHRRIVSDHLIARNIPVLHIMGAGRLTPASLTPGAQVRGDGSVVYPGPGV
ncbi:DUF488 family protein [Castellaniella ginsengisoli]|uniref:DUF488 domain-containing protein n=1 Tax=Castellaniella ginsengisoli TaxID=546114 RepID=A0AB39CH49_9BURK